MKKDLAKQYRKISRDFKAKVKLTEETPLEDLEKLFVELYDFGLENYIKTERERHPQKSEKEIIIEMYQLREKLKGRKIK